MPEIIIGLKGRTPDLNELTFSLFEAGMLREGLERQTSGEVIIVLKEMPLRKGVGHGLIEIGLFIGQNVGIPLFVCWLYDKWKNAGEKPISVRIENHFYQFDTAILEEAIEQVLRKQDESLPIPPDEKCQVIECNRRCNRPVVAVLTQRTRGTKGQPSKMIQTYVCDDHAGRMEVAGGADTVKRFRK